MPRLEAIPVIDQFLLMKFRPSLNQAPLSRRHRSFHYFNWVNTENCRVLLIISMKVRRVMSRADFPVHPDDYAVEAAQFRHDIFYAKLTFRSTVQK